MGQAQENGRGDMRPPPCSGPPPCRGDASSSGEAGRSRGTSGSVRARASGSGCSAEQAFSSATGGQRMGKARRPGCSIRRSGGFCCSSCCCSRRLEQSFESYKGWQVLAGCEGSPAKGRTARPRLAPAARGHGSPAPCDGRQCTATTRAPARRGPAWSWPARGHPVH